MMPLRKYYVTEAKKILQKQREEQEKSKLIDKKDS
jgi:hypothetical protein